ncbi:MAG: response regulator [Deltaproteobacteria bacterium]|nr:response regulator [Deltaproteobacteria bacterium]
MRAGGLAWVEIALRPKKKESSESQELMPNPPPLESALPKKGDGDTIPANPSPPSPAPIPKPLEGETPPDLHATLRTPEQLTQLTVSLQGDAQVALQAREEAAPVSTKESEPAPSFKVNPAFVIKPKEVVSKRPKRRLDDDRPKIVFEDVDFGNIGSMKPGSMGEKDHKPKEDERAQDHKFNVADVTLSEAFLASLGLPEEAPPQGDSFLTEILHPGDSERLFKAFLEIFDGKCESLKLRHLLYNAGKGAWRPYVSSFSAVREGELTKVVGVLNPVEMEDPYFMYGSPGVKAKTPAPGNGAGGLDSFEDSSSSPRDKEDSSEAEGGEQKVLPPFKKVDREAQRAETERYYHLMLDSLPIVCSIWNTSFEMVECNAAVMPMFKLPDKISFSKYFQDLSPPYQPDGQVSSSAMRHHMETAMREGYTHFEWLFQTMEGDPVQMHVTLAKLSYGSETILVSFAEDQRDLKATEAELERERTLLQKILDNCPISFLVTVANRVRFITPFARKTLGLNVGDSLDRIYHLEEEGDYVKKIIEKKGSLSWHQVLINSREGNVLHMLLNAFKTDYSGDIGQMYWLMDVTEMAEKEQALSAARELAEASTRAKSEFLANMSHEIRTPMNAIIGLTHLALQTELSAQQEVYIERTQSAAQALLRIINDILDFSKIEAGKLEMEKTEFSLDTVISEAMELQSMRATEKNLELWLDMPEYEIPPLIGDPVRLQQIIINLLSNAIKFTNQGEVGVKIEFIEEIPLSLTIHFTIQDTGIGLTQEQLSRLFTPFTQGDSSTTRKFGGTGLGLTITKRLVEMMEGQIECESTPGKGSSFSFTARFGLKERWERQPKPQTFQGSQVLIVDDNSTALRILGSSLISLGFEVKRAKSGDNALALIHAITRTKEDPSFPSLLILDWNMPGTDGPKTLEALLSNYHKFNQKDPPSIMMIQGPSTQQQQKTMERLGVKATLAKPYTLKALHDTLEDVLIKVKGRPKKSQKTQGFSELVAHHKGAKILLVEDNEVNQLVASRILKKAGFLIKIAANGLEAIEEVQKERFDLVLMDIQMPEMDGIEATKKIRELPGFAKLPIVAMTAHAMSSDRDLSISAGMNDHVSKPIDVQELFKTIAKWLDDAKNPDSSEASDKDPHDKDGEALQDTR